MTFSSKLVKKHAHHEARVMQVTTAHGEFMTPTFMPVGTRAAVNCMTPAELRATKSQIILGGNTYHMLCAPGLQMIQAAGGMHKLMAWDGPMLTDSGGFQILSLSKNRKLCKIDENGAHFKHPHTGQTLHLTPESSIQAQKIIGADIIMAFDQCTPDTADKNEVIAAMIRTHRWLKESIDYHQQHPLTPYGYEQALFGIIQGSSFYDLRIESTQFIVEMNLPGIAIGGEVIGFDMTKTAEIIDWIRPYLPEQKLRYTMGVGLEPQNLIDVVKEGVDIFDCVAPTRNARHGNLYCGKIILENNWLKFAATEENDAQIAIKKSKYANDHSPIMEECTCTTCQQFTRAYLHYLFKEKSLLYYPLACAHNVHVMQMVCEKMREIISRDATHRVF